jgi:benzoyl-CoA reductase subunit C
MSAASLDALVARTDALLRDVRLDAVRDWKARHPGTKAVGYLPVFAPVELITAAGMLPVGIIGGGDQVEIIRGDAYFQSYICHLPRSVIELGVNGALDCCDGFLFPSTCDVIRNLSGIWKVLFPGKYVHYVDVPQDFSRGRGGAWYRSELELMRADLGRLAGREVTDADLWRAIRIHDENRRALRELYDLRAKEPWKAPTSEVYRLQRAGLLLPADEHAQLVRDYIAAARGSDRRELDQSRVVLTGAFCEQPPLDLIVTLERAGCYIVDDDLVLGPRMIREPIEDARGADRDPIEALVDAFLTRTVPTAFVYIGEAEKGAALCETVATRRAEGVLFASPSFCDPSLLDRPMLARALDRRGISHTSFKYAENTGQFQTIREQAGTFADSLKLWSDA